MIRPGNPLLYAGGHFKIERQDEHLSQFRQYGFEYYRSEQERLGCERKNPQAKISESKESGTILSDGRKDSLGSPANVWNIIKAPFDCV